MKKIFLFYPKKNPRFFINKEINKFPFLKEGLTLKNKNPYLLIKKYFKFKVYLAQQVHSDKILILNNKNKKRLNKIKADALVTNLPEIAIGVKIADCIGSVLIDVYNKVVAVVHSGWRGIEKKIILKTIKLLRKKYNTKPENLLVSMSPAIGVCCYEIGDELYKKLKKDKLFSNIFKKKKEKIFMDLHKANLNLCLKAGVKKKNIFINKLCTFCNKDLFFSYRREGKKAGRMIYFIKINKGYQNER